MFCKNCGNILKEDDRFCGECGTKVTKVTETSMASGSINQENHSIPKSKSSKKQLKQGIGVVVLIAVLIVGYLIFKEPSANRRTPEQTISHYYDALKRTAEEDAWQLYSFNYRSAYTSFDDSRFVEDIIWESEWYNNRYGNNWTTLMIITVIDIDNNFSTVRVDFPDNWVDYFDLVKENDVWKIENYYYNSNS